MMKHVYYTIREPARGLYKEKGSKFIAMAFPVSSEEEISEQLGKLRKEYHDARHHCYAWRLGPDMKSYRSNDDGEPAGSAGPPILGQIRSKNLTNVLIVVVRYFGGTLLGVGGLIRAYKSAAADALEQAPVIREKVYVRWQLNFGYPRMNAVMRLVKEFDLVLEHQQFDTECQLVLAVWKRDEKKIMERIALIGDCRVTALE